MKRPESILNGFSACERLAILTKTNGDPTPDKIKAVSENQWRCMRAIGDRFIGKLIQKGMLGEQVDTTRRALVDRVSRMERSRDRRIERLYDLTDRAQRRIQLWKCQIEELQSKRFV